MGGTGPQGRKAKHLSAGQHVGLIAWRHKRLEEPWVSWWEQGRQRQEWSLNRSLGP